MVAKRIHCVPDSSEVHAPDPGVFLHTHRGNYRPSRNSGHERKRESSGHSQILDITLSSVVSLCTYI